MACCTTRERVNLSRWRSKKPEQKPVLTSWPKDIYVYRPDARAPRQVVRQEINPAEAEWLHAKMLEFMALREKEIEGGMKLSTADEINAEVARLRADGAVGI